MNGEKCEYDELIKDLKKAVFTNGLLRDVTSLKVQMKFVLTGVGVIILMLVKMLFFK